MAAGLSVSNSNTPLLVEGGATRVSEEGAASSALTSTSSTTSSGASAVSSSLVLLCTVQVRTRSGKGAG